MNEQLKQIDRTIAEAVVAKTKLEGVPGHRAAMARGQVEAAQQALRQARAFLETGESGTWTKTT